MRSFEEDLSRAITFHGHLCGGQITGVRMARYALKYFGIEDPDHYRDLIVYVECDRCLTDAIMVVTGCHPGKRRMKCLDFGVQKVVVNYTDLDAPGKPHSHVICAVCGEEVTDGREVQTGCGKAICRSCAGQAYYEMLQP